MLIRDEVENAVRLQACGYQLLKWLEKALRDGFITPEAAGTYATSEDAAYSWLHKHYLNLPDNARPERSDLRAFGNFFSTYLDCTFDLDARPGKRLYSPDAHCFCPICSWMVQKPHPKKIGAGDKKVAERMKRTFLVRLAKARGISVTEKMLEDMLQDRNLREPIGLCTYAADLLQRLKGRAALPKDNSSPKRSNYSAVRIIDSHDTRETDKIGALFPSIKFYRWTTSSSCRTLMEEINKLKQFNLSLLLV